MKLNRQELKDIESSFFDVDKDRGTAKIVLQYESIEDIIDPVYVSEIPVLKKEFMERMTDAFGKVSPKYKVDFTIRVNDLGKYTEEQAQKLLEMNSLLRVRSSITSYNRRTRTGIILIVIGITCFLAMMMINHFWDSSSIWRDVFFYIFDIMTTVAFWQAMMILIVEKEETRVIKNDLKRRLASVRFEKTK